MIDVFFVNNKAETKFFIEKNIEIISEVFN